MCVNLLLASVCLPVADKGESWEEGQPVSGVQYKDRAGQLRVSQAHLTICCDGMYSTFRKQLAKPDAIHHPSFFVGLLLRDVALPFANHGHVVLAEPSPVLFYPISSTEVR
jgi:squalene monooxygenase